MSNRIFHRYYQRNDGRVLEEILKSLLEMVITISISALVSEAYHFAWSSTVLWWVLGVVSLEKVCLSPMGLAWEPCHFVET